MNPMLPGGTYQLADGLTLTRMGYGAMQLAGPHVFGPVADHDGAIAILRAVVNLGITHIDTSDYYGPYVTNQLIKEALHPYPQELHLVTKIGARRDNEGNWLPAIARDELIQAVHDNLTHLGIEALDVVNFRVMDDGTSKAASLSEPFSVLAQLQREGLIRHLGLSNVTAEQIAEAQTIAPIVCVQNLYNIAHRNDDALIDSLAKQGIAYVPFFPLGGFTPLQSTILATVAERLHSSPMIVALAWLMQRSPNILLIPGTASIQHLKDNVEAAKLHLPDDVVVELNTIAGSVRR